MRKQETCEGYAVETFLRLLARDIEQGRNLRDIPAYLLSPDVQTENHPVDPDDEIMGEVAL